MNWFHVFLIVCLMSTVFLAGCHEPAPTEPTDGDDGDDGGDGTDGGDEYTLTLEVQDAPSAVNAGENITLTVDVTVSTDVQVMSTHSGFHWGYNSSEDADPSQYASILGNRSPHVTTETTYPGSYTVENWTIPEDGEGQVIYYRAHVNADGRDHWGPELQIIVNPLS